MEEKGYTLRGLQSQDVFRFAAIIKKIGFAEIKGAFSAPEVQAAIADMQDGDGDAALERVGLAVITDVVGIVLDNLDKVEDDIYRELASLSGMDAEQIKTLPIDVFADMIVDVFKKEEFKDFFKAAARLTK